MCVNTLAVSNLKDTSVRPEAPAEKAEKMKLSKFEAIRKDYHLIPIAVCHWSMGSKRVKVH